MSTTNQDVQEYYGKTLQTNADLKTHACCTLTESSPYINELIEQVADEVRMKYYGCGITLPAQLEGLSVLDLGSGSGRDCFVASKLVGPDGKVVGLDMTKEQLEVANRYVDYHRDLFGYDKSNIQFIEGNIEQIEKTNLTANSFDLVISNCVINLVQDKQKILQDVYGLLKEGGEMYFSDIYSDRRVPTHLQNDKVLWGECLSGSLYWNDFLNMAKKAGFADPRLVESASVEINDSEIKERVGDIGFHSATYRLMKIDGLESHCEDYGQAVRYKGGIYGEEKGMLLDEHHYFPKGKVITVCGNTWRMLNETRFKDFFEFHGNWETHYGIFEGCGTAIPFNESSDNSGGGSCC